MIRTICKYGLGVLMMAILVCQGCGSGVHIVDAGLPKAVIVLGGKPTWLEKHAAGELVKYIKEVSGASLQVVSGKTDAKNQILVGRPRTNPAIKKLVDMGLLKVSEDYPGLDGFIIKTVTSEGNNYLILSGSMDRSVLYAAYELLESELHCGFFWDGEYIPKSKDIAIAATDIASRPYFEDRFYNQGCAHAYTSIFWNLEDWKRELDWSAKKKQNLINLPVPDPHKRDTENQRYNIDMMKKVFKYCRQLGIRTMLPIGKKYVKTYGTDHIYKKDPYPEKKWKKKSADEVKKTLLKFADDTYKRINSYDPKGIWYISGWAFFVDPKNWTYKTLKQFMDVVPEDRFYVCDVFGENPVYKKHNCFHGRKWGIGFINIFGKMHLLKGDMEGLLSAAMEITRNPRAKNCKMFYINPESTHNNNLYFEFATKVSWDPRTANVDDFIKDYSLRRYGKASAGTMGKAWKSLERTLYNINDDWPTPLYQTELGSPAYQDPEQASLLNDLFCVKHFSCMDFVYSTKYAMEKAISCEKEQSGNILYQNDMVDIFRTHVYLYFNSHAVKLLSAYTQGDTNKFQYHLKACRASLPALEKVLASRWDCWVKYQLDKLKGGKGDLSKLKGLARHKMFTAPPNSDAETCVRYWWKKAGFGDYQRTDKYELYKIKYRPKMEFFLGWLEKQFNSGRRDIAVNDWKKVLSPEYKRIHNNWLKNPVPDYARPKESMVSATREAYYSLPALKPNEFKPIAGVNVKPGDKVGYKLDIKARDAWQIRDFNGKLLSDSEKMIVQPDKGFVTLISKTSMKYFSLDFGSDMSQYPIFTIRWKRNWTLNSPRIWMRWLDSNGKECRDLVLYNNYEVRDVWTDTKIDLQQAMLLRKNPGKIVGIDIGFLYGGGHFKYDIADVQMRSRAN